MYLPICHHDTCAPVLSLTHAGSLASSGAKAHTPSAPCHSPVYITWALSSKGGNALHRSVLVLALRFWFDMDFVVEQR